MSFYLDASAMLPMLVSEPASAAVTPFATTAGKDLLVSEFAAAEVASALARLTRMGALDVETAQDHLTDFDAWRAAVTRDVAILGADIRLAHALVRRFELGLRAPDALHAAVCRRGGHTLVTLDHGLKRAATAIGLEVLVLT